MNGMDRVLAIAAELKASASLVLDEPTWVRTGLEMLRIAANADVEARLDARSDTYPNTFSLLVRGHVSAMEERFRALTPAPVFVRPVLDSYTWRVELDLPLLSRLQAQCVPVDRQGEADLRPNAGDPVDRTEDGCRAGEELPPRPAQPQVPVHLSAPRTSHVRLEEIPEPTRSNFAHNSFEDQPDRSSPKHSIRSDVPISGTGATCSPV